MLAPSGVGTDRRWLHRLNEDDGIDDVSLRELTLRNGTVLVRTHSGTRVRKQFQGEDAAASQRREVHAYNMLRDARTVDGQPITPGLIAQAHDHIVLDAPLGSSTASEARSASGGALEGWTSVFGKSLAALHSLGIGDSTIERAQVPWIMDLLDYRFYLTLSSASRDLLRLLYQNGLRSITVSQPWRETAITHGDIKWSNLVLSEGESEPVARLIDWELCGIGDPAWDVGSFLSEFLLEWATSIPIVPGEPADRFAHLASRPIEGMQPDIHAFWLTYMQSTGAAIDCSYAFLMASTRYAGARLIQSAFERAQTMATLGPQILLLAQLGINVMVGPDAAAERLLGVMPAR